MTIEIIYDHTRVRSTEYNYMIVMDGDVVGAANTCHAAELVAQEIERREDIEKLKGAIAALDTVDQAISAELTHLDRGGYPEQADPPPDDGPGGPLIPGDDGYGRCPCGSPALFFVQYPHRTYGYCPDCYREQSEAREPLLAQCAHAIRSVLGNVPAGGGIIDELRRVERQLTTEGW